MGVQTTFPATVLNVQMSRSLTRRVTVLVPHTHRRALSRGRVSDGETPSATTPVETCALGLRPPRTAQDRYPQRHLGDSRLRAGPTGGTYLGRTSGPSPVPDVPLRSGSRVHPSLAPREPPPRPGPGSTTSVPGVPGNPRCCPNRDSGRQGRPHVGVRPHGDGAPDPGRGDALRRLTPRASIRRDRSRPPRPQVRVSRACLGSVFGARALRPPQVPRSNDGVRSCVSISVSDRQGSDYTPPLSGQGLPPSPAPVPCRHSTLRSQESDTEGRGGAGPRDSGGS